MSIFDPTEFQQSPNGPLNDHTVARLVAIKARTGMSYAALGGHIGLSQAFTYNLINKAANVGTQHIERIVTGISTLEASRPGERAARASWVHSYHLRPDLQINLDLPADLTEREAERLSLFIRSLPVA